MEGRIGAAELSAMPLCQVAAMGFEVDTKSPEQVLDEINARRAKLGRPLIPSRRKD